VPIPNKPPLVTIRFVAVEEPMTNEGPEMPLGFTERSPHGEVEAMPTLPELIAKYVLPVLNSVEEALSGPATCNCAATEEEAEEINPPYKDESPDANNVEEAFKGPDTVSMPATEEDAADTKPLLKCHERLSVAEEDAV